MTTLSILHLARSYVLANDERRYSHAQHYLTLLSDAVRMPDEQWAELVEQRQGDIELDDYEAVNLLWLLRVARQIGLDTGDWLGQLLHKLEKRGHSEMSAPNSPPMDTAYRLDAFAKRHAESGRITDRHLMERHDADLAEIRRLDACLAEARAEIARLRCRPHALNKEHSHGE